MDLALSNITYLILEGMRLFIPNSTPAGKKQSPRWFTKLCESAVNAKTRAFNLWRTNPTKDNLTALRTARNSCKDIIHNAKRHFLNHIAEKLIECPSGSKSFWSLASRITNNFCGSTLPPLIDENGLIVTSSQEKANILASHFATNSNLDDINKMPPIISTAPCKMRPTVFMTRKTRTALRQLDASKSTGPDGIPVRVLKQCAPELAPILTKLFQRCYEVGYCPSQWKIAEVVPVPKKGDPSNPSNYRPIAITSVICKVMETLLAKNLLKYPEQNNLISDRQYGFRKSRSTGDLLAHVTGLWSNILNVGGECPVVSLDIL